MAADDYDDGADEVWAAIHDGDDAYVDGRLEDAQAWYLHALEESDGMDEIPVSRLAVLARETGDLSAARAWFARLGDGPDNLNDLGTIEFHAGDRAAAEELWLRAADGGCADALFNLALLAEGRGDRAGEVRWLTKAADAGVTQAMVNLGSIAHRDGNVGQAVMWSLRALEHHPDMAAFNLGVIYCDRGNRTAARAWFLRAADAYNVDALAELEALDEDDEMRD